MRTKKFKLCEAVVWEPGWAKGPEGVDPRHPLKYGEVVFFLGESPNVPGHCLVVKYSGETVTMIHTDDCRKATEEEV